MWVLRQKSYRSKARLVSVGSDQKSNLYSSVCSLVANMVKIPLQYQQKNKLKIKEEYREGIVLILEKEI